MHTTPQGFTLLELLIYLGILSLMSVILVGSFLSLTTGRAQSESRTEVDTNLRFAVVHALGDVKAASMVSTPAAGQNANTLQLVVGGDTVLYSVASGVLQRTLSGNPPEPITSPSVSVGALAFIRSDNYNSILAATTTSIQILLTLRYNSTAPEWSYASTMRASATLR